MTRTLSFCQSQLIIICLIVIVIYVMEKAEGIRSRQMRTGMRRTAQLVRVHATKDVMSFIALCDPGYCVDVKQKQQLSSCIGKDLMKIFNKCTLSGAEECDAPSTRIIRTCLVRNTAAANLTHIAQSNKCHKLINEASIKCMTNNWNRSMNKISSDAIREMPIPKHRGMREIEFT